MCEFPIENATTDEMIDVFKNSKTIAIVGLSSDSTKPSYGVARYLKTNGFKIIPVNPKQDEILGEVCYPDLQSIPSKVDIVDIFRKPEFIPDIVDSAIEIGAKTVWMQSGLAHNESADKARKAGLQVVMNKCIMVEHKLLG